MGYPVRAGTGRRFRHAASTAVTVGATVPKPLRRSAGWRIGVIDSRGIPMTFRHQTWVADAFIGSTMLVVLYFILVEFSKARLP